MNLKNLSPLLQLVLVGWLSSKVDRLTKDHKTVDQARENLKGRIGKMKWLGGLRKKGYAWVDKVCDKSRDVAELREIIKEQLEEVDELFG